MYGFQYPATYYQEGFFRLHKTVSNCMSHVTASLTPKICKKARKTLSSSRSRIVQPANSGMVAREHAAPETPWQPPWSQHVVVDAASAEFQGRPWHGRNDEVEIPDEPQSWAQTGGAAVDKQEAQPGRSCRSRVLNARATPPESGSSH